MTANRFWCGDDRSCEPSPFAGKLRDAAIARQGLSLDEFFRSLRNDDDDLTIANAALTTQESATDIDNSDYCKTCSTSLEECQPTKSDIVDTSDDSEDVDSCTDGDDAWFHTRNKFWDS